MKFHFFLKNLGLYILFDSKSYFYVELNREHSVFQSLLSCERVPVYGFVCLPFTNLLYSHTRLSHRTSAGRSGRPTKYADYHHVLQTINSFTVRLKLLLNVALTEVSGIKLRGP